MRNNETCTVHCNNRMAAIIYTAEKFGFRYVTIMKLP